MLADDSRANGGDGEEEEATLLHTDSSLVSSSGLMYSNPSNSDWSILLMTSLWEEPQKEEELEELQLQILVITESDVQQINSIYRNIPSIVGLMSLCRIENKI